MKPGRMAGPLVVLLLATLFVAAVAAVDVPYLTGRVVDNADIMTPDTRARLAERLQAHEQATGNQVVVLTVPTIQPDSIEDYAVEVFRSWKLGQKDRDNGVLVVVVPQDRKMRIEVGYGLEPLLTDALCSRIIRNVMTPAFKEGNYDKGIDDGTRAIVALLEGKVEPPDAPASGAPSSNELFDAPSMPWGQRILLGAFIFGIIGLFTVIGVMTPGAGWFLYVFLIPFWAMFPIPILGSTLTRYLLGAYLIGYPIAKLWLKRTGWYRNAAKKLNTKGRARIGGFTVGRGSSGGGFSSGGSSSGGGFSGGGGGSGGGGSSGSW